MRYPKQHAEEIRSRLIKEGGRYVKEHGIHSAGVDGIARRAGLTGAALYTHFDSKEDFVCAVLREKLAETARRHRASGDSLPRLLENYMSLAHARRPATGCTLPALAADVARSDRAVRRAFDDGLDDFARAIGEKLEDPRRAHAVLAAAAGAVAMARAVPDDDKARAILDSTRELILAGLAREAS